MKPSTLLLSALFMVAGSGALAQGQGDACSPQYGACMDRCASRPQSLQESCSQNCEAATNRCYDGLYGHASQDGQPAAAAGGQPAEPEARAARDQAKPSEKLKRRR